MLERIEKKLDNSPLLCAILKGLFISGACFSAIVAVGCLIATFTSNLCWAIGFAFFSMACGVEIGVAVYLYDEHGW
jgi:hypothetical protein